MERKSLEARFAALRNRLDQAAKTRYSLSEETRIRMDPILEELNAILHDLWRASDELLVREDSVEQRSSFPQLNPNPVLEADLTGHVYYQNPAAQALFPDLQMAGPSHPWLEGLEKLGAIFDQGKALSHVREVRVGDRWFQQSCYFLMEGRRIRIYGLEITQRKSNEEELLKTTRRLRGIMESISDGFFALDRNMTVTYFNPAASRLLGRRTEEVLGKRLFDAFPEARGSIFEQRYTQALQERTALAFETHFGVKPYANWYDVRVYPFEDGLSIFFQVITDRKHAEQALKRSTEEYQLLSETAGKLLAAESPQEIVNDLCLRVMACLDCDVFFNFLVHEHLGRLHLNAFAGIPDQAARKIEWLDYGVAVCGTAARDACRIIAENIPTTPDPRTEIIKSFGIKAYACHPLFARGRVIGTLSFGTRSRVTFTDEEIALMKTVADQVAVAMERQGLLHSLQERAAMLETRVQERTADLQRAKELLERIFSSIGVLIAYMDKDFNFIRVNRAYAESDGSPPEFYVGKNHFAFFPNAENEAIFQKVVETGEPYLTFQKPFEYAEHPERGITYWDWSLHPVKEPDGTVSGVVLTLVDVTERVRAQEKLRGNEQLLRTTMELLPVGLWITDKEGRIVQTNPAGLRIWAGAKYVGIDQFREYKAWWAESGKLIEPEDWAVARAIRKGEASIDEELEIECFDGTHKMILNSAVPIRGDRQEITGVVVVNQDITERKQTEKRISSTNALLDLFSKTSERKDYLDKTVALIQQWTGCRCVGIRVLDDRGFLPYETYSGFSREFWNTENWLSLDKDVCACVRVVKGVPEPQDAPCLTASGSFCCNHTARFAADLTEDQKSRFRGVCISSGFLSVAIIPIPYRNRRLGAIHLADEKEGRLPPRLVEFIESMAPLIGEAMNRFNLETGLRENEEQLRSLSSRLMNVTEDERKRFAREIHDGIGQSLSAVKFRIESLLQQKGKWKEKERSLEELVPLIRECIDESRRVQMDLRPSMIDDLGILPTINWFCREFEQTYASIRIEKHLPLQEQDVPDSLKIVLFRMLQEALNNVAKHSKATRVDLHLRKAGDTVEMVAQDNGQGFSLQEALSKHGVPRGLGLASMRERAELSGGTFSIDSAPGKGTTVRAAWPLIGRSAEPPA